MRTNLPKWPRSLNSTTPVTLGEQRVVLAPANVEAGLSLVPRCRTMIEPPGPVGRQTPLIPSRCALESRRSWNCLSLFYAPYVTYARISPTLISVKACRWPMVFLYCFLRLELENDHLVAAAVCPPMVAFSVRAETMAPSWNAAFTGSSTSAPTSPGSFSTRTTLTGETTYCFPPVSIISLHFNLLLWEPEHTELRRNHWSNFEFTTDPAPAANAGRACFSLPVVLGQITQLGAAHRWP